MNDKQKPADGHGISYIDDHWRSNADFEEHDDVLFVAFDSFGHRQYYVALSEIDRGYKVAITVQNMRFEWAEVIAWMPLPALGAVEARR